MLFDSENISLEYEARGKCLCWDTVGDVTNMYGLAGLQWNTCLTEGFLEQVQFPRKNGTTWSETTKHSIEKNIVQLSE